MGIFADAGGIPDLAPMFCIGALVLDVIGIVLLLAATFDRRSGYVWSWLCCALYVGIGTAIGMLVWIDAWQFNAEENRPFELRSGVVGLGAVILLIIAPWLRRWRMAGRRMADK